MINNVIDDFIRIIDSIYGVFLDGCRGFETSLDSFKVAQFNSIEKNKRLSKENEGNRNKVYNLSIEDFDDSCFIYARGKHGEPDYKRVHYRKTQAEFKQRNSPNGHNYKFIGNMTLISIYAYWEHSCRNQIAKHLNVEISDVKSDIFGDLRWIRHSILHHKGIALPEVERCKIFKWFKENDEIFIDGDHIEEIVIAISKAKNNLYKIQA
jgi:hypothetical protein